MYQFSLASCHWISNLHTWPLPGWENCQLKAFNGRNASTWLIHRVLVKEGLFEIGSFRIAHNCHHSKHTKSTQRYLSMHPTASSTRT
jgi:hypothetical protein